MDDDWRYLYFRKPPNGGFVEIIWGYPPSDHPMSRWIFLIKSTSYWGTPYGHGNAQLVQKMPRKASWLVIVDDRWCVAPNDVEGHWNWKILYSDDMIDGTMNEFKPKWLIRVPLPSGKQT